MLIWSESRPGWIAALWGFLVEGVVLVPVEPHASPTLFQRIELQVQPRVIWLGNIALDRGEYRGHSRLVPSRHRDRGGNTVSARKRSRVSGPVSNVRRRQEVRSEVSGNHERHEGSSRQEGRKEGGCEEGLEDSCEKGCEESSRKEGSLARNEEGTREEEWREEGSKEEGTQPIAADQPTPKSSTHTATETPLPDTSSRAHKDIKTINSRAINCGVGASSIWFR